MPLLVKALETHICYDISMHELGLELELLMRVPERIAKARADLHYVRHWWKQAA